MTNSTILLIEDNADDLELMLYALRKAGVSSPVQIARDGESALRMLEEVSARPQSSVPSLILLDLELPKVRGLKILEAIRSVDALEFVPVVILTSSGETKDIVSSYRLRANSYVRKPVDLESFVAAIEQILAYWARVNLIPASPDAVYSAERGMP